MSVVAVHLGPASLSRVVVLLEFWRPADFRQTARVSTNSALTTDVGRIACCLQRNRVKNI